jgi:transposase
MVESVLQRKEFGGRIEIRTGVGCRRRWSDEEKGRIVAESFATGAVVSEVARRHEISPQHLFTWRYQARRGLLPIPEDSAPRFVPVVSATPIADAGGKTREVGSIRIEIGGAVVVVEQNVDLVWLRDVLRLLRALS